jgi:hypothetical protein
MRKKHNTAPLAAGFFIIAARNIYFKSEECPDLWSGMKSS